jgi:2-hydroxychromene-2-carboxylate isomerase
MGEVIHLTERLADRARPSARSRIAFFFDLTCPFSYLVAERIERALGEVEWVPVPGGEVRDGVPHGLTFDLMERAERRAIELRLPLSWPDSQLGGAPEALRAAAWAGTQGAAGRFALAALRLQFCGGYDLGEREILASAADAAGLPVDDCMRASRDRCWNAQLEATARGLRARGVHELPAIRIERRWLQGERSLAEAAAAMSARRAFERPLAPAG